jgi:hypothetical protein
MWRCEKLVAVEEWVVAMVAVLAEWAARANYFLAALLKVSA